MCSMYNVSLIHQSFIDILIQFSASVTSLKVVSNPGIVRAEEGSRATLQWRIKDYKTYDPIRIKSGEDLVDFMYNISSSKAPPYEPSGDANQTFGVTIPQVAAKHAGLYFFTHNFNAVANATLFVYGE